MSGCKLNHKYCFVMVSSLIERRYLGQVSDDSKSEYDQDIPQSHTADGPTVP